jgi:hypothetical protein
MENDGILTRVNDLVAKYSEGKPNLFAKLIGYGKRKVEVSI